MKKALAMVLCVIMMALALTSYGQADEEKQLAAAKVGDTVTLGSYEQDGDETNGAEPIEWIVLEDKGDGEYLLISKYCLEAMPYDDTEETGGSWETCSLRAWLNGEFYEMSFTEDEKKLITLTNVTNEGNEIYGTENGNNTQDFVYLLNIDEANTYFSSDGERDCVATAHAVENGAFVLSQEYVEYLRSVSDSQYYTFTEGAAAWWLRSPCVIEGGQDVVSPYGDARVCGDWVCSATTCVRPVVALRLSDD